MQTWILLPLATVLTFASTAAQAEDKPDYTELSRLIHRTVIAQLPKEYEDRSAWGKTIPIPPNLKLKRLRTRVKVGDKEELPHGTWKRTRAWLDDPAKDVKLQVKDLRKVDARTRRLKLEAVVALHGERERKEWQKGLHLIGLIVRADAVVTAVFDCEVVVSLKTDTFPLELVVEPKVVQAQLELKEFTLRRIGRVMVEGEGVRDLENELKSVLQDLLRKRENDLKDYANQALAKSLKEGKGDLSAAKLLEALPPAKSKD